MAPTRSARRNAGRRAVARNPDPERLAAESPQHRQSPDIRTTSPRPPRTGRLPHWSSCRWRDSRRPCQATDFTTSIQTGSAVSLDLLTTGLLLGSWVVAFLSASSCSRALLSRERGTVIVHARARSSGCNSRVTRGPPSMRWPSMIEGKHACDRGAPERRRGTPPHQLLWTCTPGSGR